MRVTGWTGGGTKTQFKVALLVRVVESARLDKCSRSWHCELHGRYGGPIGRGPVPMPRWGEVCVCE